MLSASSAPKSWTFFWWQNGQNQGPLQEGQQAVLLAVIAPDASEAADQVPVIRGTSRPPLG
jgi:hypothetical protein